MKKIFALFLCLVLPVTFLTGCNHNNEALMPKSYTAEEGQISKVFVDVSDRQIEVTPSADDKIHIDYYENSKEFYDISVSDENFLTMTLKSNKEWSDYIGVKAQGDSRKISLQLPDTALKELKLATTNEDILLASDISAFDISLSSVDGNIDFNSINAENSVTLNAKNGNISGSIVGSYEDFSITCDIKKGDSNLPTDKAAGAKTLNATNNNGDINIEFKD